LHAARAKRERQYEKIKASARKRGRSTKTAKRIAAATVNKQRREAGETKGSRKGRSSKRKTSRKSAARKGGARKRTRR
jgi:hypothetical protein